MNTNEPAFQPTLTPTQSPRERYESFVDLYGETVSTWSDKWKTACEARGLLLKPLDQRRKEIDGRVKNRGGGSRETEDVVRTGLQDALTREWNWKRRTV